MLNLLCVALRHLHELTEKQKNTFAYSVSSHKGIFCLVQSCERASPHSHSLGSTTANQLSVCGNHYRIAFVHSIVLSFLITTILGHCTL